MIEYGKVPRKLVSYCYRLRSKIRLVNRMLIPRVKLTAVASNNGINISTGSREPSQQKGPPDPALEHLKKLSFQRLHEVCLLGSHLYIFLNESFGYETSAYSDKYQLVKKKKPTRRKISLLKCQMIMLSNGPHIF